MTFLSLKKRLSQRSFWVFYLGPLILGLLSFWLFFWPKFELFRQHEEVLLQKEERLKAYQRKIKELEEELKRPSPLEKEKPLVFRGKDPYQIVAELQKEFENIPEVSLRSFKVKKRKKEKANLERIYIHFIVNTDLKGLVKILEILKNYPQALRIHYLDVNYQKDRYGEKLLVNLEVEGLFQFEETSS